MGQADPVPAARKQMWRRIDRWYVERMDVVVREQPPVEYLIEAQAFLDSIGFSTRWLMAPDASLVVARLESRLVCGVGVATIEGATAVLMSFAVHPDFRRQRIGCRMVETLLSHLKSSGAETAYLFSRASGGFWERVGFERVPVEEVAVSAKDHFQVREFLAAGSIWSDQAFRRDL
jgi:N-acetylglutamate synthase-like GNAT family acetyltransferase